ncbi:MAG: hypothetical protein A2161_10950 [Candidatus Schekmanbacteria bacterium RBG_13_48_7]|uniref:ABC transmembrane type-1 domain-containing protein n=1 Tax=Candidatus Schekmanbacteria bacterium RBG_13_48_7 TaxID=1817878 RepID=A0A1F7RR40_9BACT|nr:MAG: hypothetical protein A2161_10950 [Candidatus Schekmanbacteria bacterium RBG_13_48_7]
MKQIFKLLRFVKPYWKKSLLSLALLVVVVLMDLAIPRLVQRVIDQGITPRDSAGFAAGSYRSRTAGNSAIFRNSAR